MIWSCFVLWIGNDFKAQWKLIGCAYCFNTRIVRFGVGFSVMYLNHSHKNMKHSFGEFQLGCPPPPQLKHDGQTNQAFPDLKTERKYRKQTLTLCSEGPGSLETPETHNLSVNVSCSHCCCSHSHPLSRHVRARISPAAPASVSVRPPVLPSSSLWLSPGHVWSARRAVAWLSVARLLCHVCASQRES